MTGLAERRRQRDTEIVRRLNNGETARAISEDMHVNPTTIRNAMRRLGVHRDLRSDGARYPHRYLPTPRTRGTGPTQQRVLVLLADGEPRTVREIAEALPLPVRRVAKLVTSLHHGGCDDALITVAGRVHGVGARKFAITDLGRARIKTIGKAA